MGASGVPQGSAASHPGVAYYEGWETAQGTALSPCNQARPMRAVGCLTVVHLITKKGPGQALSC